MTLHPRVFALDQYAATTCPVKTQNTFGSLTPPDELIDTRVVEWFRQSAHHTHVLRFLRRRYANEICDLSGITDPEQCTTEAIAAMTAGVPIIIGACLPVDWENHRCGTVDILFKADEGDTPTYYPAIIKDHLVLASTSRQDHHPLATNLSHPFLSQAHPSKHSFRVDSRSANLLQLAHLWLLLSFSGFAAKEAWGAVIGTDQEDSKGAVVTWVNLNDKQIRAFSYTSTHQWKKYSPLSRYLHEHRFRVRVATRALAHHDGDQKLVASPVHIPECEECDWWTECQWLLENDISLRIERSPLDAREIMTLRSMGVSTITDLAAIDVEVLLPEYLPRVAHRAGAETRLRLAARRGRLLEAGISLERLTTGVLDLPEAEVEIDLDIETSSNNHAYLWGFLIDDRRNPHEKPWYHAVSKFESLTHAKELDLAEQAATWLKGFIESLDTSSVLVWHYSHYEISTLQRLAQHKQNKSDALTWLADYASTSFVDLLPLVTSNFFGVDGLGLKTVAAVGAGFSWRDPEPSGLNSQFWFLDAIRAPTPEIQQGARDRILRYNEDDVRATWALRRWLRSLT
jgi:predicted RecB family nuclease